MKWKERKKKEVDQFSYSIKIDTREKTSRWTIERTSTTVNVDLYISSSKLCCLWVSFLTFLLSTLHSMTLCLCVCVCIDRNSFRLLSLYKSARVIYPDRSFDNRLRSISSMAMAIQRPGGHHQSTMLPTSCLLPPASSSTLAFILWLWMPSFSFLMLFFLGYNSLVFFYGIFMTKFS